MSGRTDSNALAPLLTIGAIGVMSHAAQAEEPEPLDEEFLDYLLQLEGEDEDWTLFDSQESEAAAKTPASKPAPAKESAADSKAPAEKTQVATPNSPTGVKR